MRSRVTLCVLSPLCEHMQLCPGALLFRHRSCWSFTCTFELVKSPGRASDTTGKGNPNKEGVSGNQPLPRVMRRTPSCRGARPGGGSL